MKVKKEIRRYTRGFTLVEMITTITILGVVSVVALPVINTLGDNFTKRKFELYEESLVSASKLYVDQNEDDLFGDYDNGCADVSMSDIMSKELIKDIELENATCSGSNTFVRVKKNRGNYDYSVSITCTLNGKVAYQKTLPASSACLPTDDGGGGDGGYVSSDTSISSNPKGSNTPAKTHTTTILLSDDKGFGANAKIRYYWINTSNHNALVGEKKEYNFKNALIKTAHTLRVNVTSPATTGNLKLVVEPVNVLNGAGAQVTGNYVSDIFVADNTPPTLKIRASVYNNGGAGTFVKDVTNQDLVISDWKNYGYYFDFSGSSDNHGIVKQIWKWNKTNNVSMVTDYAGGNSTDNKVTNKSLIGHGARYATVTVCDVANNCTSHNIKVNISTVYTIKYSKGDGNGGSTSNTTCYYGIDCKLANNGFTRTGHSFSKWNINGYDYNAGSNVKNLSSTEGGSVTATAKWTANKYRVYYHVNDGHGYNANYTWRDVSYGSSIPTDPNPQDSINEFRKFNHWYNVPSKMPDHNITVEASISDYMCMIITGHCPKDHVATFIPKLDASGWYGSYFEYLPDNGYWRIDTPMNKSYFEAVNHFNYLWNHTGTTGYYLVYGMIYCENGSARTRCRAWAPCQDTI